VDTEYTGGYTLSVFHRTRPRLTVVGRARITLDGRAIWYTIKRSSGARNARLEVRPESGLTVIIPRSFEAKKVPDLLDAKRNWILANISKCSGRQPIPAGRGLESGDTVPYLGHDLRIVGQKGTTRGFGVRLEAGTLVVNLDKGRGSLGLALEAWYRMQAKKFMKGRADRLSADMGLGYRRLTIRAQKTRWGSCSPKGNLNFNWKLMMAPEPVIDYVVVHELAHLREMNHTRKFWELVGRYCPQWRQHRKWLKDHEAEMAARLL